MTHEDKQVLVTGGSGFLGSYCVLGLLASGYRVRTTIRSLEKSNTVREMLQRGGATHLDHLTFAAADLTKDEGWADATVGCDYVLHVASPFPPSDPKDEMELIGPARDGTLRVLKAAHEAGVTRVVLTSSFAAIGYSNATPGHVFTEADWTDTNAPISAYVKSKTMAEQAAWNYMKETGTSMELTVINPTGIFGPILGADYSTSIAYLTLLLSGTMKETPAMAFCIVDVRDAADLHIRAMTHPAAAGERFLASTEGAMSIYDVAMLIKQMRTLQAKKIGDLQPVDNAVYKAISNEKARTKLGWTPRSKEETILNAVDSLALFETTST